MHTHWLREGERKRKFVNIFACFCFDWLNLCTVFFWITTKMIYCACELQHSECILHYTCTGSNQTFNWKDTHSIVFFINSMRKDRIAFAQHTACIFHDLLVEIGRKAFLLLVLISTVKVLYLKRKEKKKKRNEWVAARFIHDRQKCENWNTDRLYKLNFMVYDHMKFCWKKNNENKIRKNNFFLFEIRAIALKEYWQRNQKHFRFSIKLYALPIPWSSNTCFMHNTLM